MTEKTPAHVMIDLETMGTRPDAAIVSIGAVSFNIEEGLMSKFYVPVSLKSSVEHGGTMDPDTILWWMQQSDEACKDIIEATTPIDLALRQLDQWMAYVVNHDNDLEGVWGNGAMFDNVIINEAYRRLGKGVPWTFRHDKCYRTKKSESSLKIRRIGTHHNALDDAKSQALHLIEIWKEQRR